MKTKTTIPWAAILTQYNNGASNYICENSPIFRKLWESNKKEIKEFGAEFLKKIGCQDFYVLFDSYRNCLFYFDMDSETLSTDERYEREFTLRKEFLEYMFEKTKPKTKYSYFRHAATNCFGNPGGPAFLIRRNNKTGEFETIYYNQKRIHTAGEKWTGEHNVDVGNWVPANQKEINKARRMNREPKYLYYRYFRSEYFGNPGSKYQYIIRYNVKTGVFYSMFYDKKECNNLGKSHLWHDAINKGEWIPARQKEIRLAIKLNK